MTLQRREIYSELTCACSQNPDAADLGSYTAFVYFVLSGAGLIGTFFLIPEMKGRSPAEIDKMFAARVPTRSFIHWTNTNDISI